MYEIIVILFMIACYKLSIYMYEGPSGSMSNCEIFFAIWINGITIQIILNILSTLTFSHQIINILNGISIIDQNKLIQTMFSYLFTLNFIFFLFCKFMILFSFFEIEIYFFNTVRCTDKPNIFNINKYYFLSYLLIMIKIFFYLYFIYVKKINFSEISLQYKELYGDVLFFHNYFSYSNYSSLISSFFSIILFYIIKTSRYLESQDLKYNSFIYDFCYFQCHLMFLIDWGHASFSYFFFIVAYFVLLLIVTYYKSLNCILPSYKFL